MSKPESTDKEFGDLADGQKRVIDELAKEDDPFDPDRTKTAIARAADVHDSYIGKVQKDREEIIQKRKEELDKSQFEERESDGDKNETQSKEDESEADDPWKMIEEMADGVSESLNARDAEWRDQNDVDLSDDLVVKPQSETIELTYERFELFAIQMSTLKSDAENASRVSDDCVDYSEGKLHIIREVESLFNIKFSTD